MQVYFPVKQLNIHEKYKSPMSADHETQVSMGILVKMILSPTLLALYSPKIEAGKGIQQ